MSPEEEIILPRQRSVKKRRLINNDLRVRARRHLQVVGPVVATLLIAGCGMIGVRPPLPPQPLPEGPIVDIHCHVAGLGAGGSGCFTNPRLLKSWKTGPYLHAYGVNKQVLAEKGDLEVARQLAQRVRDSKYLRAVVVLALDTPLTPEGEPDWERTEFYVPNAYVVDLCQRFDGLLYGASLNPLRPDALARLEQAKRDGAVIVKWLPAIQHFRADDPRCVPFYHKLVELGLPLLVHTGAERAFTGADDDAGDPETLRLPLSLGVTVIAAHCASTGRIDGQRQMDRLLPLFEAYPRLYADISSLTQINKLGYLAEILKSHPEMHDRLLYGSDYPLIATPLVSPWYFLNHLSPGSAWRISRERNPFDRDVLLKQALGVPAAVFERPAKLLEGVNERTRFRFRL